MLNLFILLKKPFQAKNFKHLTQNPTLWFFFQANNQEGFFLVLDDETCGGAWIEVRAEHRIEFYIGFGVEFVSGFIFVSLFSFCQWKRLSLKQKYVHIILHIKKWLLRRTNSLLL